MSEENKQLPKNNNPKEPKLETEGYKPIIEGYQPTQSQLDSSKPPQGGSGVPTYAQCSGWYAWFYKR